MKTKLLTAFFLLSFASACGPAENTTDGGLLPDGGLADGGSINALSIVSTLPASGALDVSPNGSVSVVFSEPMDPASLSTLTFTLTAGTAAVVVPGVVVTSAASATFWPTSQLPGDSTITATLTTGARSLTGKALATNHVWIFATGAVVASGQPVNLGMAGTFAILAKSAISTVPVSAITGNIGVSPAAATFITGFTLTNDATNVFATSSQLTGQAFAADSAEPTPTNLTTAVGDMELAFTDAAGRAASITELGAGNLGGATLTAGVYSWSTALLIPTDVTLSGSATDVWVFQIAQDLTLSSGARVVLARGALAKNVFWQVAGKVDLGTTSHCEGVILSQTAITLGTGASVNGRLLAQTAVSLDGNTVVQPAP